MPIEKWQSPIFTASRQNVSAAVLNKTALTNFMNPHLVEIAYVLDRSGSMQGLQEAAIAGFNQFVKSQLDVPGDARLTLVLFDDEYLVPCAAAPIQDVPELNAQTYVPRGSTALLDAIGRTIKDLGQRLVTLSNENQPGKVIVAIFTDGLENASREYTRHHISDLIRLHRNEKGWEFLFLAANQDAIASAAKMAMTADTSGNVSSTPAGYKSSGPAFSRKVRALRMKTSGKMDAQAMEDDAKPMGEIVKEEEERGDDKNDPNK